MTEEKNGWHEQLFPCSAACSTKEIKRAFLSLPLDRILSFTQLEEHRSLAYPWNNCWGQNQVLIGLDLDARSWTSPDFRGNGIWLCQVTSECRCDSSHVQFVPDTQWEVGRVGAGKAAIVCISSWNILWSHSYLTIGDKALSWPHQHHSSIHSEVRFHPDHLSAPCLWFWSVSFSELFLLKKPHLVKLKKIATQRQLCTWLFCSIGEWLVEEVPGFVSVCDHDHCKHLCVWENISYLG